jgi:hypothetical protein
MTRTKFRIGESPLGVDVLPAYFTDRSIIEARWRGNMAPQEYGSRIDGASFIVDLVLAQTADMLTCEATIAPASERLRHITFDQYIGLAQHQGEVAYVHAPRWVATVDRYLAAAYGKSRRSYPAEHPWVYLGRESRRDWRLRLRKSAGPPLDPPAMTQLISGLSGPALLFGRGTLSVDYHR